MQFLDTNNASPLDPSNDSLYCVSMVMGTSLVHTSGDLLTNSMCLLAS